MKIYVASSWRNTRQPAVVEALRAAGHDVYDFHHPTGPDSRGFHWSDIDPAWKTWTPAAFVVALAHPIAKRGFARDMLALRECDACVLVLPCGRSAHLELGHAAGADKITIVLMETQEEPELMLAMCDLVATSMVEVVAALDRLWSTRPHSSNRMPIAPAATLAVPHSVEMTIPETTHDACGGRALEWCNNGIVNIWHCTQCGVEWPKVSAAPAALDHLHVHTPNQMPVAPAATLDRSGVREDETTRVRDLLSVLGVSDLRDDAPVTIEMDIVDPNVGTTHCFTNTVGVRVREGMLVVAGRVGK